MSRAQLIEMTRRNIAHVKAGSVDQAPGVFRVPATNYYDRERWQLEMKRIFKRLPLVLGFSVELREPGAYRALEVANVPVLLTRTADGDLHSFLNVCSHRGAIVVPEGSGKGRRFTCPYHSWSYDNHGELVSIYKQDDFGEVDTSCLGLTRLPVAEAHHDFEHCHLVGRQHVAGPNWKVAYDGYLDFYHLPILHKDSFGPKMPSDALYDAWGPHQRVSMPDPRYLELEQKPEEEWNTAHLIGGVWTVFPHISIADFDAGGKLYMVSQLFPGATPDDSVTVQNFLATSEPDPERQTQIDGVMKFLEHVVRDEDYYTGKRIQKAVKTGAKSDFLFGRNEAGGQRFHRWVERLIHTEDAGLPKLLAEGID
jgi:phenylpropionate dioxygenase-like ring-hydroxylating dioxygenase large terminal subunit